MSVGVGVGHPGRQGLTAGVTHDRGLLAGLSGFAGGLLGLSFKAGAVSENLLDRVFANGFHHGLEHVGTLVGVFNQRVALGHGPQSNTFLEVVHFVQVLAPVLVHHGQQQATLQGAHGFFTQLRHS